MHLILAKTAVGLLVGFVVGLTGLGAGVLLMPILIFAFGVPPIVAVGSDAVFNAITKLGCGYMHYRQRSVDWHLIVRLLIGSIPGAILGVAFLAFLRAHYGTGVNEFLRVVTGLLLIAIPAWLLFQGHREAGGAPQQQYRAMVVGAGFLAGLLVGMTSIGSGTVSMVLLMMIIPGSPALLIGTDIVHAVVLTGFISLLHARLGTVDPLLVAYLLLGSIPGSLLGTRLSGLVPGHWLKRILCCALLLTGARMLMV